MDPEAKKMWMIAGTTGAVGLEIGVAVGIGYFGGRYLDARFGTSPWLMWIGFGAGIGAGVKALIRVVRAYERSLTDEDETKPSDPK